MAVTKPYKRVINQPFKAFRMKAGLSQTELAKKIGISPQLVCRWETGRSGIAEHHFDKLAKVFKTTTKTFAKKVTSPSAFKPVSERY